MKEIGIFPFGNEVTPVVQRDRSAKDIFILGVYASAVHARWIGPDGKKKVKALAVASEPEIFWTGKGVEAIIRHIKIPEPLGRLLSAGDKFNGPSGRSLDEQYLSPLGITRQDVWLCDIYPYARLNPKQLKAIEREYSPLIDQFGLPRPTLEKAPQKGPGGDRCKEIWSEISESNAKTLVLLGDKPIAWFLSAFDPQHRRLSDFGRDISQYGNIHNLDIRGKRLGILPLVHPRQASRLGDSSVHWARIHNQWKEKKAPSLL